MRKLNCLLFLFLTCPVYATDLILTGADSSKNSSYYYLGYITPFHGNELGSGYVSRFWLDYIEYDYASGNSRIQASAPGISYSIGFQRSVDKFSFGAFIGAEIRKTELSPNDSSNNANGTKINPLLSLEAQNKFSDFSSINFNGSLEPNTIAYWSRVRLGIGNTYKTGPEISIQGDSTYHTKKFGWFLNGINVGKEIYLGGKLGATKTDASSYQPYVGIDLVKSF